MAVFSYEIRAVPGAVVIDLHGDLDGRAGALGAAYDGAVAEAPLPAAVVLNFGDVGYINSTGIALVVALLARAMAQARSVRVCGLSEHYRHIFEITRLADFMSFFPDEATAVSAGRPTAPA